MNDITFIILKLVVSVCAALVTAYLIPYIKTLRNDKRYASLLNAVEVAVRAAEQTFKESGQGARKKEEVMTFVREWMQSHGISISSYQLDQLIECAVYRMKNNG